MLKRILQLRELQQEYSDMHTRWVEYQLDAKVLQPQVFATYLALTTGLSGVYVGG